MGELVDAGAGVGVLPPGVPESPDGRHALVPVGATWVRVERLAGRDVIAPWISDRMKVLRRMRAESEDDDDDDEDVRTIHVRYTADGERHFPFHEAVTHMFETEMVDFAVQGPRTTLWRLRAVARSGGGPISRHFRWVREAEIPAGDRSIYEHAVYSRALEHRACFDGLNLPNLALVETLVRRLQLIEEAHVESPTAPSYEGAEFFAGHGERRGGALVAPTLREHVAGRLKDEAIIMKERCKVRESRTLGGGGGPKGDTKGGGLARRRSPPQGSDDGQRAGGR